VKLASGSAPAIGAPVGGAVLLVDESGAALEFSMRSAAVFAATPAVCVVCEIEIMFSAPSMP
jgi:hypothetical protein